MSIIQKRDYSKDSREFICQKVTHCNLNTKNGHLRVLWLVYLLHEEGYSSIAEVIKESHGNVPERIKNLRQIPSLYATPDHWKFLKNHRYYTED